MRTSRLFRSTSLALALTVAFAASFVGVSAARAAAKSTATSTPVDAAAGGPIDMQMWLGQGVEGDQTAIITVVEVDATTKLPVTVRIPVTPGTTVEWAGEILGGPAESDIQQPFKLVQGQGGQFAEFTLSKSHRGQIDAIGLPLKVKSDSVSVEIEYVQSVSSPLTALSVRIPANTSKAKISPKPDGDPVENADGESLYSIKPRAFKAGEKQKISVAYSTIPPVEKAPGSELNLVLVGLGVALALAVVVMIVIVRRNAPAASADGSDEDDAFEDEDDSDVAAESSAAPPIDDDRPFDDDGDEPDLKF
jgi:hypothetical protein